MESVLHLSIEELAAAIRQDLTQYAPQLPLLAGILRLVSGDPAHLRLDTQRFGAWVRSGNKGPPKWHDAASLVEYAHQRLTEADLTSAQWRDLAGRVFQTPCRIGSDPATREPVVLIDTGMARFQCRQCGRCCRCLEYRHGVSEDDIKRWHHQKRQDILDWVEEKTDASGNRIRRIWVDPQTGRRIDGCPFLKRSADSNRYGCTIHRTKPELCREYPVSRKHAFMTGCPGIR